MFTSRNTITLGAVRALAAAGLQHRVGLVGFDDVPLGPLLQPGITVVAQDPHRIVTLAAQRLVERMNGDDGPPRTEVVSTSLVVRGSGEVG